MIFLGQNIFLFEPDDTIRDIAAYSKYSVHELCRIMKGIIYGTIELVEKENDDERDRTQDH